MAFPVPCVHSFINQSSGQHPSRRYKPEPATNRSGPSSWCHIFACFCESQTESFSPRETLLGGTGISRLLHGGGGIRFSSRRERTRSLVLFTQIRGCVVRSGPKPRITCLSFRLSVFLSVSSWLPVFETLEPLWRFRRFRAPDACRTHVSVVKRSVLFVNACFNGNKEHSQFPVLP